MIVRVKDFASVIPPECRDLFGDKDGDDYVSLALAGHKGIDVENKRLTFVASDDSIDLHDEVIDAGAFHELRGVYMANPVILSGHQHRLSTGMTPVIAYAAELHTNKNPLTGVAQFGSNAVSLDHWLAYRDHLQRAFSVGFRSRDMEKRDGRWVHTKALLLEISGVPVPANSNALVLNYVMGRIAQYGGPHAGDQKRAEETAHMLRELEEQVKALTEAIMPAAELEKDDGEDGDADDSSETEREIAECFEQAVGLTTLERE